MQNFGRAILSAVLMLLLTGCLPTYKAMNGEATTKVNIENINSSTLCIDGVRYSLSTQKNYAIIPVGKRITLLDHVMMGDGYMNYSCSPQVSFVPREGVSYYAKTDFLEEACRIGVYREGGNNRVGLSLEPTIARGTCSK